MGVASVDTTYDPRAGWQAWLRLGFIQDNGRTLLKERSARGPLAVQRPFYPEGGLCHVYVLHPPGGIAGGDELFLDIKVAEQAQALVTTPGASKVYRSNGPVARQQQRVRILNGASLEWLPQESIIFDGARVHTETSIELSSGSRYLGWEIVCLGRPACEERYLHGESEFNYRIWRDGRPLLLERLRLAGGDPMLTERWGMQSLPVFATMLATPATTAMLETLRENITPPDGVSGMSLIEDLLVCRYLGDDVEQAKRWFRTIRSFLRPEIILKPINNPRIWNT